MTEQQRKAMEEDKYLKMMRDSEDYHDTIDCEIETRKELVEREKMMKPWTKMGGPTRDKR